MKEGLHDWKDTNSLLEEHSESYYDSTFCMVNNTNKDCTIKYYDYYILRRHHLLLHLPIVIVHVHDCMYFSALCTLLLPFRGIFY